MASTAPLLAAVAVLSAAAACVPDNPDYCQVFEHSGLQGAWKVYALPVVASSSIHQWGSNSVRKRSEDLGAVGLHDRISSVRIKANRRDVSLYLYERDNFHGRGRVYRCEKGETCWLDDMGSLNDRISSLICQYEYEDEVDEPGSEDVRVPMAAVAERWNDMASTLIQESANGSPLAGGFPVPGSHATRIVWVTRSQVCEVLGWVSCDPYQDVLKVRHDFVVDMPFPLRSRDVRISLFLQPHLQNEGFGHWYHGWEVWTEGGIGSGTVLDLVVDAVDQLDPHVPATLFTALEARPSGRALVGKQRLQMSISPTTPGDDPRIAEWSGDWNVPTMVMNRYRDL